jgi:hypothetical protein
MLKVNAKRNVVDIDDEVKVVNLAIYLQITTIKKTGLLNPEEIYLEDKFLREEVTNYINV